MSLRVNELRVLTDRDRVQELLQELGRHDGGVVVRPADRRLQRLDHRVVVGLVEVDQRDERVAEARGYQRVSLETGTMDAFGPARALYRKAGFRPCAPFGPYTVNPYSVCMTMALAGAR